MIMQSSRKLYPGVTVNIKPAKGLSYKMILNIKWYGWPVMMWKCAKENMNIKWYQYPKLVWLISKTTINKMFKGGD